MMTSLVGDSPTSGDALMPVRKHLAPRPGQKSRAANVVVFMK